MKEKILSDIDVKTLRSRGVITESEVALIIGDLVVAENVITKERRILKDTGTLSETSRRILRD